MAMKLTALPSKEVREMTLQELNEYSKQLVNFLKFANDEYKIAKQLGYAPNKEGVLDGCVTEAEIVNRLKQMRQSM